VDSRFLGHLDATEDDIEAWFWALPLLQKTAFRRRRAFLTLQGPHAEEPLPRPHGLAYNQPAQLRENIGGNREAPLV